MAQRPAAVWIVDADGNRLESMALTVRDSNKPFTSGARGYNAGGKIEVRGSTGEVSRHQVSINIVEIGTKGQ